MKNNYRYKVIIIINNIEGGFFEYIRNIHMHLLFFFFVVIIEF